MLLYIDPGTGSMLFTILIGVLGAGAYKFKDMTVKARFLLSGGKTKSTDNEHPDYVIFSDHKRYWNVFEPVCDEFEKRKTPIVYMTASPDDPALDKEYEYVKTEFIGEGNKAFASLNTMHADIVLSTTPSLDVLYWKRSKHVKHYVHIPHAASDLTMYRMFGIDFYDTILTSGDYHEEQIRALEKVRKLPEKEIVKVGLPFLDTMKDRVDKAGKVSNEKKTVLVAPSWGSSAIFSKYGGRIIDELLKTDYDIIIRPHPQSFTSEKEMIDSLMQSYPESDRLHWNRDNDNFDVLRRADIMISDFSGVMFDFSLVFDKPLIYTDAEYDDAPYDACWLDEEPWTFRVLPKLGSKLTEENMKDIGALVEKCLTDKSFEQGRAEARAETWAYIGESASRVADYLIDKHEKMNREIIS
ncbi:MAG: CDP-glycerol glycerophosphotransferase family protein [Mogibacterium sp.]|nr:CDP-glycerol glycerophosphotransferase family protein [Mogibacterium sp.]MBQ6501501.1 CDP-glycerol glycerophosphotransferase family protein [Mogibacterium sp.]